MPGHWLRGQHRSCGACSSAILKHAISRIDTATQLPKSSTYSKIKHYQKGWGEAAVLSLLEHLVKPTADIELRCGTRRAGQIRTMSARLSKQPSSSSRASPPGPFTGMTPMAWARPMCLPPGTRACACSMRRSPGWAAAPSRLARPAMSQPRIWPGCSKRWGSLRGSILPPSWTPPAGLRNCLARTPILPLSGAQSDGCGQDIPGTISHVGQPHIDNRKGSGRLRAKSGRAGAAWKWERRSGRCRNRTAPAGTSSANVVG